MRIVLKIGIWTLTGIIALCIVAVSLLYAPPVQDWLRRQLVETAMRQTGLKVKIDGIGLRFPLKLRIRGVWVADTTCTAVAQDTLLYVRGLDVGVQAAPLLHGKMEVDGITLEGVRVNSADLLPGLQVAGDLERFFVAAHGIDLKNENARLDRVELDGVLGGVEGAEAVPDPGSVVLLGGHGGVVQPFDLVGVVDPGVQEVIIFQ